MDMIFKLLPLQNSPSWPKIGVSASNVGNKQSAFKQKRDALHQELYFFSFLN